VTNARWAKIAASDVESNRRRGGDLRTMLSPGTVKSTSGFMGVLTLAPGECVTEHYHPYSEEFIYLVSGRLLARLDGEPVTLDAGEGLFIPVGARHRLENNDAGQPAFAVFHLGPLAPRPDLGHVDTEPAPSAAGEHA
jgi:putative monooxygenase